MWRLIGSPRTPRQMAGHDSISVGNAVLSSILALTEKLFSRFLSQAFRIISNGIYSNSQEM
jgi:hypothetical protein